MHISCIHILSFLFICFWLWCVLSLFLSLCLSISLCLCLCLYLCLSRIDCIWHPKCISPLRLGTLLVSGLLLLILPFPLFTFSFVMWRPKRTSLRTFRNMAFIRSAMLFCWILPTLLSLLSFRLGVRNLFVRDPWGVPSCLYRSSTGGYTWYWYFCTSVCHNILRYTYHSYPGSYIQGTTCFERSAS